MHVNTTLTFQLVVTDSKGLQSNPSTVTITVFPSIPPIADAGRNQEVQPHQTVHLDGSASFDPSGFTPLTYEWAQRSGPSVSLANPDSATPSFTAPDVNKTTVLTFQLIVTNSNGIPSIPSSVAIEVLVLSSAQQNNGTIVNSHIKQLQQ